MIRLPSRLDDETEKIIFESMTCGFTVHKAIGPGYGESFYRNAFCIELLDRKIPLESEKRFVVKYRGRPVGTHRLDLVVRGRRRRTEGRQEAQARPRSAGDRLSKRQRPSDGSIDEFRRRYAEGGSPANRRLTIWAFIVPSCPSCHRGQDWFDLILCHSASMSSSEADSSDRPDAAKFSSS